MSAPVTRRLVAVSKRDQTWHWDCRWPLCQRADWAPTQPRALSEGLTHVRDHLTFGFREAR
jgi:hypothetical protein